MYLEDTMEEQADDSNGVPSGKSEVKQLVRSRSDQWIAGVCGGFGEFFGIDSNLVRVVLATSTLFGGAGLVVYAVCWLIIPLDGDSKSIGDQLIERIQSNNGKGHDG